MFKGLDWPAIILYLLLVGAGIISIYAASYNFDNAGIFDFNEFSGKQFMWAGLGLLLGGAVLLLDYRVYEAYAYPIYGCVILLLIATIFVAPDIKGSRDRKSVV